MIKWFAVILLTVFIVQILTPVLPWMDYYLNHSYIVENLCIERDKEVNTCNGCCHLKKEIKKVIPQSHPLSTEVTRISNSSNVHSNDYILNLRTITKHNTDAKTIQAFASESYSFEYNPTCFHPPKSVA